jgi:hypothetical protein
VRLDPTLNVLDFWAPSNWATLDSTDADLGSSGPLLLPGGLVFQIGKQGVGYLLSASNLGHQGAAPRFQASVCSGSFGGGIYAGGVIYVACSNGMHALSVNASAASFSPVSGWSVNASAIGPPIFAGGLVWSAGWGTGVLYGLDPASGATRFSASLGSFHHFTSPSAGGGRLFVANGDKVTSFTVATPPPATVGSSPPGPTISHIHVRVLRRRVTLTLTLSEPAKLTVVLRRVLAGRRVNGQCRLRARTGGRCVVLVRRATRRPNGRRGRNTFRLRLRPLPPGRYSLAISARDAGGRRSKVHKVTFRVRGPSGAISG